MTFDIYWSPEGRCIATVTAKDAVTAKRMTPKPYRKHMGEVYVVEAIGSPRPCTVAQDCLRHNGGCTR